MWTPAEIHQLIRAFLHAFLASLCIGTVCVSYLAIVLTLCVRGQAPRPEAIAFLTTVATLLVGYGRHMVTRGSALQGSE